MRSTFYSPQIERMDTLFEAQFSPLSATGKPLSKCGKCARYMKYIPMRPARLYCSSCEEVYNVPQNGAVKLYKELRCPLDNFELVLFSLSGPGELCFQAFRRLTLSNTFLFSRPEIHSVSPSRQTVKPYKELRLPAGQFRARALLFIGPR